MKKHNLLLLSYIFFIVICIIARSYFEFDSWPYVVSAVSIASAFLSYADFFHIHANYYFDSCDMAERFVSDRKHKIEKEKAIIDDIHVKIAELKDMEVDVSQEEKNFEAAKEKCLEAENVLESLKNGTELKRKKQKNYSFWAEILTVCAFLSFLCALTFTNLTEKVGKAQDIVSVIAFLVVLSSQYVNSIFSEEHRKENKRHDNAVKMHDMAHEHIFEVYNHFNIYYEKVKDYAN